MNLNVLYNTNFTLSFVIFLENIFIYLNKNMESSNETYSP